MIKYRMLFLLFLRIAIGWHFLFEGLVKLFSQNWSATSYLNNSYGFLSGIFHAMGSSTETMQIIDLLNVWGLIVIGACLILGILVRFSAIAGIFLLLIYYLAYPPFGLAALNSSHEGHYWLINRNLIEIIALWVIFFFPSSDYSIINLFKKKSGNIPKEPISSEDGLKRREILKGLVSLPILGGVIWAAKSQSLLGADSNTGATTKLVTWDLKDLKGELPKGKIGNLEISRLIMGCNLIGGWAHSRDLHYVGKLFRNYNTESKIFETFKLAEQTGINTTNLTVDMYPFFNRYKKINGSKMLSIAQIHVMPQETDRLINFKKAVDQGATSIYIQGANGDMLVKSERLDLIQEALDYTRSQGMVAGIGAHSIEVCIACDKAGIKPDYYLKTMHHDQYWSANPREFRIEFNVDGKRSIDHNMMYDNIFDLFPEKTVDFFSKVDVPLIGFKVLSAGAITPKDGFRYAFENGADFICVGMFDFQVIEDVNLVTEILTGKLNRTRPWYS